MACKEEYASTGFAEVVLVMSVAGQKMIKLNKCSVLSQALIRSGRAQGEVSPQERFKAGLFWIPAFPRKMQCGLCMYFFILVEVSIKNLFLHPSGAALLPQEQQLSSCRGWT